MNCVLTRIIYYFSYNFARIIFDIFYFSAKKQYFFVILTETIKGNANIFRLDMKRKLNYIYKRTAHTAPHTVYQKNLKLFIITVMNTTTIATSVALPDIPYRYTVPTPHSA